MNKRLIIRTSLTEHNHWPVCKLCQCMHKYLQCQSKKSPPPPEVFWHFFPNGWGFLDQILHTYYTFLSMLDYKFLSNYLQFWWSYAILSATNWRAFQPMDILSIWWWSRLIWHNFVTVGVNWIEICRLAWIGTHNRCVKFELKIPNRFRKNVGKIQGGGIFWTHAVGQKQYSRHKKQPTTGSFYPHDNKELFYILTAYLWSYNGLAITLYHGQISHASN